MLTFKYTAIDPDGSEVKGTISSETPTAAGLALADKGLEVTRLAERKSVLKYEITKKKVSRKDLMHFSRQMAVFLRAGITVLDAIGVIREETPDKAVFAGVLDDMAELLRSGSTFSAATRAHPEAFPAFYVGVVEAAEMSGNLDAALDEVSNYIDRDLEARRKIQSALFYPAIVFLMSIATVVVLTAFVLPRFEDFFAELDAELPLPTRMMLGFTHFVADQWPFLLAGILIVGLVLGFGPRTKRGRAMRDASLLRMPIVGDLVQGAIVERFCRTLSSMVRSGVSLPDALVVTSDGTTNVVYQEGLTEVRQAMLQGEGLAAPIARSGLFPGAANQMIRVGEETGTLDLQLQTSAEYYGRDLDFKLTRFTSLFEPAVIIFMGVVVGFVAIALVSAMYGIFNTGQLGS
ncbi:MAG: type II secretion system F family protein [Acidimicrobiia bacterium]